MEAPKTDALEYASSVVFLASSPKSLNRGEMKVKKIDTS